MIMKKKQYISPEAEVFVCKTNAMLMASKLDPESPSQSLEIDPEEDYGGEFSSHGDDFVWEEE